MKHSGKTMQHKMSLVTPLGASRWGPAVPRNGVSSLLQVKRVHDASKAPQESAEQSTESVAPEEKVAGHVF